MTPACQAAVAVGRRYGFVSDAPVVLHETYNTVVWLRPHEIVAKVGTRMVSAEELVREHAVALTLVAAGAPVAEPLAGAPPVVHPATGFTVTLWHRLEHDATVEPPAHALGESLRLVHAALAGADVDLPDFRVLLHRPRDVLADGRRPAAMDAVDAGFLRRVFDALLPAVDRRRFRAQPLHGEPHRGNRLMTPLGVRWIDFETVSCGPLEWDLAFLPEPARLCFPDVDQDLLALLSSLNSARIATWCGIQSRFPEMVRFGQAHLAVLRATEGLHQFVE